MAPLPEAAITETAFSRRALLKRLGIAGAAAFALPELSQVLQFQRDVLARQTPRADATVQAPTLSPAEMATLGAVCARILPSDAAGPGAREAGAPLYIDRALGEWLASSRDAYTSGLAAVDAASLRRSGRRFVDLSTGDQDAVLTELESTPFFALVRSHTIQGTFCDPLYGGNVNFAGWDLIGYPGVRLTVTAEDQQMASPPKPVRRSAYDYVMFSAAGVTHAR